MAKNSNIDLATVQGFGEEWTHYDQTDLPDAEANEIFLWYFGLFEFDLDAEGFDLGCGSGRWARMVAPRVKLLHCVDPSDAIEVARRNLSDLQNIRFHRASADDIPLADDSQDFGYSLGVLHHIPDPQQALDQAVRKLRPGGQMLIYIYYALENRRPVYRAIWRVSNVGRRFISNLPFNIRRTMSEMIAVTIYWPLARTARLIEKAGFNPAQVPLAAYRSKSLYTMRTDALDRFGTKLEHRFTRIQIEAMMRRAGLTEVRFSENIPFWVAVGRKSPRA